MLKSQNIRRNTMSSLKRFVENNFRGDKYPCGLATFVRVMSKNGYIYIKSERTNATLESDYYFNEDTSEVIEIMISYNSHWTPMIWNWDLNEVRERFPYTRIPSRSSAA